MSTLVSTLSGTTSNSYVATVAEADDLAATLAALAGLGVDTAGYLAATSGGKTEALIIGARGIDSLLFRGDKVDELQSMQFPRNGTINPIDEGVIPDPVKMAQVAEACAALSSTIDPVRVAVSKGVRSESAGRTSFSVRDSAGGSAASGVSDPTYSILKRAGLLRTGAVSVYGGRG